MKNGKVKVLVVRLFFETSRPLCNYACTPPAHGGPRNIKLWTLSWISCWNSIFEFNGTYAMAGIRERAALMAKQQKEKGEVACPKDAPADFLNGTYTEVR